MIKNFILFFIVLVTAVSTAQRIPLSEGSEVSLITVGPGNNLNDAFGHNGFRIKDETNKIDIIYDYGRYDFDTPNFYLKFARGKLLYEIGVNNFEPFLNYYKNQNRSIKEQVLDLSYSEKQALFNYLQHNAKPENKKYKYDFFYDNCATKMRDVLIEQLGDKLKYKEDHITEAYTFRQLIQKNVKANSWGSLGMDLAIGAVVDRPAKPIEYQFLPEYVLKGAENATININGEEKPLVKKFNFIFEGTKVEASDSFVTSPLFVFSCIGLLILFITYKDFKNNSRSRVTDLLIFIITGSIGVLVFLLWFATDHSATANNYNLLWAMPVSLFLAPLIFKKEPKRWLRKYVFFLILMFVLLTIHWISGVQTFAIGLLPLFIALALRYLYVWRYLGKSKGLEIDD